MPGFTEERIKVPISVFPRIFLSLVRQSLVGMQNPFVESQLILELFFGIEFDLNATIGIGSDPL